MQLISQFNVRFPIDNGAGDSCGSYTVGPIVSLVTAMTIAKGKGLHGRDADIEEIHYISDDGGKTGVRVPRVPIVEEIPREHAIVEMLPSLKPGALDLILRTFRR